MRIVAAILLSILIGSANAQVGPINPYYGTIGPAGQAIGPGGIARNGTGANGIQPVTPTCNGVIDLSVGCMIPGLGP